MILNRQDAKDISARNITINQLKLWKLELNKW